MSMPPESSAKISVVIACVNGLASISECLETLERQIAGVSAEIIVVNRCRDGSAEFIRNSHPAVKLIDAGETLGVPHLRAIGMDAAAGELVVIIEDHCMVCDNWFRTIKAALSLDYGVIGGAVENGSPGRLVDWAVYLCEYSFSMLPIPSGEVDGVSGNNVCYRREVLQAVSETVKRNYWEYFLQQELKKNGVRFYSLPSLVVLHKKEFGFWYFMRQRFYYSRSFAGMRAARMPLTRRLIYACASPILPALMSYRTAHNVFAKKRHVREFILSLPILALFMVSYALGEFTGYLMGGGGSLSKVE